jgi:hypothetical protein
MATPCTARLRLLVCLVLTGTAAPGRAEPIPVLLTAGNWTVSQKNFKLTQTEDASHNGEIGPFLGRESLRVSKGLFYSRGVNVENGTIDVDMAPAPTARFFGLAFHVHSEDDYELIFFRPRSSGTDQAIQYTPVFRGAPCWQIYSGPGCNASANIPRNEWMHVRLVVAGRSAKLFLNNASQPSLVIPDLKLGPASGGIGFWGHMGDAYVANPSYTPDRTRFPAAPKRDFPPGMLTDWELSDAFDASRRSPETFPDVAKLKWEKVQAESPGMVVINRYRESPNILPPDRDEQLRGEAPGAKVVFAKTTIHSDRAEVRKMNFGYSDKVVVYLNGKPLYAGNNSLSFRQLEFRGVMDVESDAVFLPLQKGDNELMLSVTEFFGGWGLICRLNPRSEP